MSLRGKDDLPRELGFFACDTGDLTHTFSGSFNADSRGSFYSEDEQRVRRVYKPGEKGIEKLFIGRYKLVEIEVYGSDGTYENENLEGE